MTMIVALLVACGNDDTTGAGDELATEAEGTYSITRWEETDCGGGNAADVLADRASVGALVEVYVSSSFGTEYVGVAQCQDEADCANTAESGSGQGQQWLFPEGSDEEGYTGQTVWAGPSLDTEGSCVGSIDDHALTVSTDAIRIDTTISADVTFAEAEDGICWTDAAQDAAQGAPCASKVVIEAERL